MRTTKKIRMHASGVVLILALLPFTGKARGDSASAAGVLDWGSASFSGPVTPGAVFGDPRNNFPGTQVQSEGIDPSTNVHLLTTSSAAGWPSSSTSVQFGPENLTQGVTGAKLTTSSTNNGNYYLSTFIEDIGTIPSTNGTVTISIPYNFNVTTNPDYFSSDYAVLELLTLDGGILGDDFEFFDSQGSRAGTLVVSSSDLPSGSYPFVVWLSSTTEHVPEPSSLLLLAIGLICLAGLLRRGRSHDPETEHS